MAASWNPTQYGRFAAPRLRPAIDLLARIPPGPRGRIIDLGCGGGQVTRLLRERWPDASITGVDSSAAMLERARGEIDAAFVQADLAGWNPQGPVDLLVSNAALHWLEGHERHILRWLERLAPGGIIAIQMPRNHDAPSHRAMAEAAAAGPWSARLAGVRGIRRVGAPKDYARLLAGHLSRIDIWETTYIHVLTGPDPVVEWTMGSGLRPYLDALGENAGGFIEAYRAILRTAYPPEPDGTTLFPFKRVFVVGEK
jgi:trans-aconitate 2-methyltransferase